MMTRKHYPEDNDWWLRTKDCSSNDARYFDIDYEDIWTMKADFKTFGIVAGFVI